MNWIALAKATGAMILILLGVGVIVGVLHYLSILIGPEFVVVVLTLFLVFNLAILGFAIYLLYKVYKK